MVTAEDMAVLGQRVILLQKQWDELYHQVALRRQHVLDRLHQWTAFNDKYKEICDWLNGMEVKVSSNSEYHIEDLLVKLQKVRFKKKNMVTFSTT